MHEDTIAQGCIEGRQGRSFIGCALERTVRQGRAAVAFDDTPAGHDQGLARKDAPDAGKNGRRFGRELQLQQLVAHTRVDARLDQSGGDHCLRLGGEG